MRATSSKKDRLLLWFAMLLCLAPLALFLAAGGYSGSTLTIFAAGVGLFVLGHLWFWRAERGADMQGKPVERSCGVLGGGRFRHAAVIGLLAVILYALCLVWRYTIADPSVEQFHLLAPKLFFPGFAGYDAVNIPFTFLLGCFFMHLFGHGWRHGRGRGSENKGGAGGKDI